MNLVELALITYTESLGAWEDEAAERAAQEREGFLTAARGCAEHRLGSIADELVWTYTPSDDLPVDAEEATAPLAPGRPEYLRYRYQHDAELTTFELVQPCYACRQDRITEVNGLTQLGELLHQDTHPVTAVDTTPEDEPGPLAAIEAWETRAADVSRLTRRLIAQHPDAGLAVSHISSFGHSDGSGRAEVHFDAADVAAVQRVAATLGAEVTTSFSSMPAPYGHVLEHATASGQIGVGVDVQLRGYTKLPDDQAAAWRAQQDQATEPAPEAGEG